jgi:hypothetical protein
MKKMKYLIACFLTVLLVSSCGTPVAYTDTLKDQYDLTPEGLIKVQFFTSSIIILEKSSTSGNQTTGDDGTLVSNSSKTQDRVIIPPKTKCVYEKTTETGEIVVRFEVGTNKTLSFAPRATQNNGKYYLVADWKQTGGTINYGNETYNVQTGGSSAYLEVKKKSFQRTKRKDRIVKGMKV